MNGAHFLFLPLFVLNPGLEYSILYHAFLCYVSIMSQDFPLF